jgi:adenosine deaminase
MMMPTERELHNPISTTMNSKDLDWKLRRLAKVELHRHLEGAIRLQSMLSIIKQYELDLPSDRIELKKIVQIDHDQPQTTINFLSKFAVIRRLFVSEEVIRRLVYEAVEDAATENIRHLELKFTPAALAEAKSFKHQQVMDWVIEATREAILDFDISVSLIASVNRHEVVQIASSVAEHAIRRAGDGVQGLDLAGNEGEFLAAPFRDLFLQAAKDGLGISIHAGEWCGPESVRYALLEIQADRIGHGVRILEDPELVQIARDRRTTFEVCLTSNLRTGITHQVDDHPLISMIQSGLAVTLNTDDPAILGIDLTHEYTLAVQKMDLSLESLKGLNLTASQAAFLPPSEIRALENKLQVEYSLV